ncbi:MAG: ATP:cob(I)alamin adenosyltransferase [Deinococcales bacterium]
MKIYTKTGDGNGVGGERISKHSQRVRAYGEVDELNAYLGLIRALLNDKQSDIDEVLKHIQHKLFNLGADLATKFDSPYRKQVKGIKVGDIEFLEEHIDLWEIELKPLQFLFYRVVVGWGLVCRWLEPPVAATEREVMPYKPKKPSMEQASSISTVYLMHFLF